MDPSRSSPNVREQKSPMAKGKVEAALARLDRLGLREDVADVQESMRRANLFTSVAWSPSQPTLS